MVLLMEEILHHLLSMKPYEKSDILHINWYRIPSNNSSGIEEQLQQKSRGDVFHQSSVFFSPKNSHKTETRNPSHQC